MKDYVTFIMIILLITSSYSEKTSKVGKISKDYKTRLNIMESNNYDTAIEFIKLEKKKNLSFLFFNFVQNKLWQKIKTQESIITFLEIKNKVKKLWMLLGGVLVVFFFRSI